MLEDCFIPAVGHVLYLQDVRSPDVPKCRLSHAGRAIDFCYLASWQTTGLVNPFMRLAKSGRILQQAIKRFDARGEEVC